MIEWFIKIHPFFGYASTRMLLAAATALILTICIGPFFIRMLFRLKIGQKIRKEECPRLGELHENKSETPTMGGVLILFSMSLSLLLWMDLSHSFTWILGLTTFVLGGVGFLDDWLKIRRKNTRGLIARYKFVVQILLAAGVASYLLVPAVTESISLKAPTAKIIEVQGKESLSTHELYTEVFFPFFKKPWQATGVLVPLLFLLFMFVITGTSNAVNLTDGLDGLASGALIIAVVPFIAIAFISNNVEMARYLNVFYIDGAHEVAIYLSALVGSVLGFLWYNSHPAQIFMGDAGSLPLGGILGVSAILLRREFLLAIVGGIFVIEALSVILQVASFRMRQGKRLFLCSPIHHHFEYGGMPETRVVTRFWIVGFLLAIIGLLSLKLQ